jgi:hypothetical protein
MSKTRKDNKEHLPKIHNPHPPTRTHLFPVEDLEPQRQYQEEPEPRRRKRR